MHFKNHEAASVFCNIYSGVLRLRGMELVVKPAVLTNGDVVTYLQRALEFATSPPTPPPAAAPAQEERRRWTVRQFLNTFI